MKPPRHVDVGPHRYRIVVDDDGLLDGAGRVGQCVPDRLTIALSAGMPHTQAADTVIHEICHAALNAIQLDDGVEESVCLCLAPALLQVVRSNPSLLEWLTT